jgi:hypothetical protein
LIIVAAKEGLCVVTTGVLMNAIIDLVHLFSQSIEKKCTDTYTHHSSRHRVLRNDRAEIIWIELGKWFLSTRSSIVKLDTESGDARMLQIRFFPLDMTLEERSMYCQTANAHVCPQVHSGIALFSQ